MHNQTHPEIDERERLQAAAAAGAAPAEPKTLRESLARAKDEDGLTLRQLANKLRYSPSVVSQYLNGEKYSGDKVAVERNITEFLRNRELRRHIQLRSVASDVTDLVHGAFRMIRRTNDVGVIYGPAGAGKSTAISLYSLDNPMCVVVTLHEWCKSASGVERLVFDGIENGAWKQNTSRGRFVADRLRGSDRLLIVDNAHKATVPALDWIFDLHDETGIPVALVGNAKMLGPIQADDQRFSRVGYQLEVQTKDPRKVVKHLVAQIAPAMAGEIEDLLEQVAAERGGYRAVAKEASLAARLAEDIGGPARDLLRRAHAKLLRPAALA